MRAAQVWVRAYWRGGVELSDGVLLRKTGSLAVVVLLGGEKGIAAEAVDVEGGTAGGGGRDGVGDVFITGREDKGGGYERREGEVYGLCSLQ